VAPVTRIGDGVYRVEGEGSEEIVYVAGPPNDRWAFWNGRVFRGDFGDADRSQRAGHARAGSRHSLSAPMPATVIKVHVSAGDAVKKGDTVVLLEAMKMELPIRAPGDAVVAAVHCREGELVQADAPLVDLQ
jgi:acetyl/propionyl-CoA carboxylase alpha subunit